MSFIMMANNEDQNTVIEKKDQGPGFLSLALSVFGILNPFHIRWLQHSIFDVFDL